jgi:hypothetical protein
MLGETYIPPGVSSCTGTPVGTPPPLGTRSMSTSSVRNRLMARDDPSSRDKGKGKAVALPVGTPPPSRPLAPSPPSAGNLPTTSTKDKGKGRAVSTPVKSPGPSLSRAQTKSGTKDIPGGYYGSRENSVDSKLDPYEYPKDSKSPSTPGKYVPLKDFDDPFGLGNLNFPSRTGTPKSHDLSPGIGDKRNAPSTSPSSKGSGSKPGTPSAGTSAVHTKSSGTGGAVRKPPPKLRKIPGHDSIKESAKAEPSRSKPTATPATLAGARRPSLPGTPPGVARRPSLPDTAPRRERGTSVSSNISATGTRLPRTNTGLSQTAKGKQKEHDTTTKRTWDSKRNRGLRKSKIEDGYWLAYQIMGCC